MLDKLSPQVADEGREHPFVGAVVREVEARLTDVTSKLLEAAADGGAPERIYQLGGRVAELKNVLRLIDEAGASE